MKAIERDETVAIFSTCPPSSEIPAGWYLRRVASVARWSERAGCSGILVYSDNSLVDPWLLAQVILENTTTLCPLVAVQPVYMHPYSVAKMVTSLAHLYGRRIYLNMVAGGFKNDLEALNDPTPHDRRYDRLVEYTTVIRRLLSTDGPVSFEGEFYRVDRLRLAPALPEPLVPGIFISGSSEAGLAAARAIGATAIKYPKPAKECRDDARDDIPSGIRIGIISRPEDARAWQVARARFPEDRKGQIAHQLAMKVSDSAWHAQLSALGSDAGRNPYWLVPFQNYKTMCPYLVGDYGTVAEEIGGYVAAGFKVFILDVPPNPEEMDHTREVFRMALEGAPCRS